MASFTENSENERSAEMRRAKDTIETILAVTKPVQSMTWKPSEYSKGGPPADTRGLYWNPDNIYDAPFRDMLIDIGNGAHNGVNDWLAINGPDAVSDYDCDLEMLRLLYTATEYLWTHDDREAFTDWALSQSLCPVHFVDYAICFDDENPECEQVRAIHPSHDT
jgi:hypothetical protein